MSELKPTDTITVSVSDFETKYVSRQAFDALQAKIAELEARLAWHPASEPPEDDRDVVLQLADHGNLFFTCAFYGNGRWWLDDKDLSDMRLVCWQELPPQE